MSAGKFFMIAVIVGVIFFLGTMYGIRLGLIFRPSLLVEMIVLNVLLTSIIFRWLSRIKGSSFFVNGYLLSIVVKLIFYSGLLLMVRIIAPKTLAPNALFLMVGYLIFTVLEVAVLFKKVNH